MSSDTTQSHPGAVQPRADARTDPSGRGKHTLFRGIIPTALTPFDQNESVDTGALRAEIRYLLAAGVHGVVVMGSFGECPYLTDTDRDMITRASVETVNESGRQVPIMVGISAHSTVMAAEQIERAHRLGADSAMVFLPQYFKLTFEDVRRHYSHLAANSPLPIFYYHYPAVNGLKFKPTQIAELLSLPNIVGIKETTFDLFAVRQHIELTRGLDRTYLAGSELIFTQFMDIGGHGIVGTSSLIMPHTALAMYSAYSKGDKSRAKELQLQLFETMPLAKDVRAPVALVRTAFLLALRQGVDIPLDGAPTQPRLKAALARRGVPIMPIARSPLPSLTADDARVVEQVMQSIERIEPSSMNAN